MVFEQLFLIYLDNFFNLKSQNLSEKFVGRFTVNYNDILWEVNSEISRYMVGLITLSILNVLSSASRNLYGYFAVYLTLIILDIFEQLSLKYLDIFFRTVCVYIYIISQHMLTCLDILSGVLMFIFP